MPLPNAELEDKCTQKETAWAIEQLRKQGLLSQKVQAVIDKHPEYGVKIYLAVSWLPGSSLAMTSSDKLLQYPQYSYDIAQAYSLLVTYKVPIPEIYRLIHQCPQYIHNIAKGFTALSNSDRKHALEKRSLIIEYAKHAVPVARAISILTHSELDNPKNRATILEKPQYADNIAAALKILKTMDRLTPSFRDMIVARADHAEDFCGSLLELHLKDIHTLQNHNAVDKLSPCNVKALRLILLRLSSAHLFNPPDQAQTNFDALMKCSSWLAEVNDKLPELMQNRADFSQIIFDKIIDTILAAKAKPAFLMGLHKQAGAQSSIFRFFGTNPEGNNNNSLGDRNVLGLVLKLV